MDKRIYMTPTLEVVKIETATMIATSLNMVEGEGIGFGGGGDVPRAPEFDGPFLYDEIKMPF